MANTGIERVDTLEKVFNGTPTGEIKANDPGYPDYIAPFMNLTNCPITYTTDCPKVIGTPGSGILIFEFSLPNSVVTNPVIASVKVRARISTTDIDDIIFTLPNLNPNYFTGSFTGLTAGTYNLNLDYLDNTATIIHTCSAADLNTTTFTVT
jgi:hypothetical protein